MPPKLKLVNFDYNKHLPQTSAEKTNDLFYLIAALFIANSEDKVITKLELFKALFKSTQTLAEKDIAFLNTYFFINTYGPFNNIFYKYLEELEQAELLTIEGKTIDLTAKGLRVASDLLSSLSEAKDIQPVLQVLKKNVELYAEDGARAINETHSLKVLDTTNNRRIKTIQNLIDEFNTTDKFTSSSQFKYIDPYEQSVKKVRIPPQYINQFEEIIAQINSSDFETKTDLNFLSN